MQDFISNCHVCLLNKVRYYLKILSKMYLSYWQKHQKVKLYFQLLPKWIELLRKRKKNVLLSTIKILLHFVGNEPARSALDGNSSVPGVSANRHGLHQNVPPTTRSSRTLCFTPCRLFQQVWQYIFGRKFFSSNVHWNLFTKNLFNVSPCDFLF